MAVASYRLLSMLDTNKVKFLKIFAIGIGVILIFLLGFGFGQMGKSATPAKEQTEKQVTSDSKEKDVVLTQDFVTEFLMVYYTKKDLSENRNRYKEYMTDTMYNQVVHLEDQPTNQTYKGFVVDFEYKDSTVYLDNQKYSYRQGQLHQYLTSQEKRLFPGSDRKQYSDLTSQLYQGWGWLSIELHGKHYPG